MLRDPIDRAVSWYYWIKDMERIDLFRRHWLRNYADSVCITRFYKNRQYSNMQTRFIAGYLSHKVYPSADSEYFEQWMLDRAKKNLESFIVFGLQGEFETSVQLIQETLGWSNYEPSPPTQKTKNRRTVDEIMKIAPRIIEELREYHRLDIELHNFAKKLFRKRVKAAGLDTDEVGSDHRREWIDSTDISSVG